MENLGVPIVILFLVALLVVMSIVPTSGGYIVENFDYSTACDKAISFFDANKCGDDTDNNNMFDWKYGCHKDDGSDKGLDLSGGFHDDGSYVKRTDRQGRSTWGQMKRLELQWLINFNL